MPKSLLRISDLKIDKGFLVTNSVATNAAKELAQQYKSSIELVDTSSLRTMLSQYKTNQSVFSKKLFWRLNQLRLDRVFDIPDPAPEQVEELDAEEVGLSEPQRKSLLTVGA